MIKEFGRKECKRNVKQLDYFVKQGLISEDYTSLTPEGTKFLTYLEASKDLVSLTRNK